MWPFKDKPKAATVGLLTQEQWDVIDKLNKEGVKFNVNIVFADGIPTERTVNVADSEKHRKVMMAALRAERKLRKNIRSITKSKGYGTSIHGTAKVDGMTVNLYDWTQCKVVGHKLVTRRREKTPTVPLPPTDYEEYTERVQVTDCQIRDGQVAVADVVMIGDDTAEPLVSVESELPF